VAQSVTHRFGIGAHDPSLCERSLVDGTEPFHFLAQRLEPLLSSSEDFFLLVPLEGHGESVSGAFVSRVGWRRQHSSFQRGGLPQQKPQFMRECRHTSDYLGRPVLDGLASRDGLSDVVGDDQLAHTALVFQPG
jgi:hypothetical protein